MNKIISTPRLVFKKNIYNAPNKDETKISQKRFVFLLLIL